MLLSKHVILWGHVGCQAFRFKVIVSMGRTLGKWRALFWFLDVTVLEIWLICVFGVVIVLRGMARRRMWKVSMLLRIERFFSVGFANYLKDVALRILAYSRTHFGGRRRVLKFS